MSSEVLPKAQLRSQSQVILHRCKMHLAQGALDREGRLVCVSGLVRFRAVVYGPHYHALGARRRFLLVQLPEEVDSAEYPTISAITRARVRNAGAEIGASTPRLDEQPTDTGFRSFSLSSSNFAVWSGAGDGAEEVAQQLDLAVDHVRDGATEASIRSRPATWCMGDTASASLSCF